MIKGLIKKMETLSKQGTEEEIASQLTETEVEIAEMKEIIAEQKKVIEAKKLKRIEKFNEMDREDKFAECVRERESKYYDKHYGILLFNWLVDEMTGAKGGSKG